MKVTAVKTKPVVVGDKLLSVLDAYLPVLNNRSVVVITSKIVSICEGSIVKIGTKDKEELIKEQADYYLPPHKKYNFTLSIKNNIFIASAGIDESNSNGFYILWPKNPQRTANKVRKYLKSEFNITDVGVLIVDSKITPLLRGVTGVSIAHSGFNAIKDYIGKPDIFGRVMEVTKANIAEALAVAAVAVIGEGSEQTPIAVITDIPFIQFQDRNPTKQEIAELNIPMEEDLYYPILKNIKWKRGESRK